MYNKIKDVTIILLFYKSLFLFSRYLLFALYNDLCKAWFFLLLQLMQG